MPEATANRWAGAPPNGLDVLRRNRVAMLSLAFVLAVALAAVVIPFFLHGDLKKPGNDSFFRPLTAAGNGTSYHLLGTDVNALDSFGNDGLGRCVLDARQIIGEPLLPELAQDLERVFAVLLAAGADLGRVDSRFESTLAERFADEPVGRFLRV